MFEWHQQKLLCIEWCTWSPHHLGDLVSWSSNRWFRLWLQASVIAEACDINGCSPWEFSNTSNYSKHLHKTMTAQTRWQGTLFAGKWYAVTFMTFGFVCFHHQWNKGDLWVSDRQIDGGNFNFSDPLLQWNDPLWAARSTRWLFPRGKDSQGHLGEIMSLSIFRPNDNLQITHSQRNIHRYQSFRAIRHFN